MKGYIRKRGATYSYTVDIGRDPVTGKRKQKTKGGFKTKKAAQEALNELVYEVNKGVYIVDNKSTFEEVANEWLKNYKVKWEKTTYETTCGTVIRWINPFFGSMKIQDVKLVHGQRFMTHLIESKLANSYIKRVFSVAKQIFHYAVDLELISKNPIARVPSPSERSDNADLQTWTFEEINRFLKTAITDRPFYHNVAATAIFTGMRKGEIMGLRKQDVDFENKVIKIEQTLHETNDHGLYFGDPKTESSKRSIAFDENVERVLKNQIRRNAELKLALGAAYNDHDLIFCREDGDPYRPSSFNRPFNRLTKKAGVPQIRFHDLRHTHATLLLELGTNTKLIAERLGHSDVKTTLNTYSHVTPKMQEEAINAFNNAYKSNA